MLSLSPLLQSGNAAALTRALQAMSHQRRRDAMSWLAERGMAEMADDAQFFTLYADLVQIDAKMWLGTCLKALSRRLARKTVALPWAQILPPDATAIDVRKTCAVLMPLLSDPRDVESLVARLSEEEGEASLLRAATMPAYFVLFRRFLKPREGDAEALRRCVGKILRRAGEISAPPPRSMHCNMASVLCAYFGLPVASGSFALRLEPYELSRLDETFETFCKTLQKI